MSEIRVKIIQTPSGVFNATLKGEGTGATIADALEAAGITLVEGSRVQHNATENAALDTPVQNGDRVVIAEGAKGNS